MFSEDPIRAIDVMFQIGNLGFWSARAEESAVINKRPASLKGNLCFPGTVDVG